LTVQAAPCGKLVAGKISDRKSSWLNILAGVWGPAMRPPSYEYLARLLARSIGLSFFNRVAPEGRSV
jgi:hypothetical protein